MAGATIEAPEQRVLGRYRPLRPLGSGGSGSVWLAHDENTGIDVALKMVSLEGKAGARAEREAAAAARLRHAGCLRAYSLLRDEGHVYIAYEYVAGDTLRQALRSGRIGDGVALEIGAQILDALAHAHARGIVHRDVKPSNVLLADGPGISVRLLDFGLAQFTEGETLTAAGDVPGTLAYISPERLGGRAAGGAADVWSVGVVLWEALAGRHPFWTPSVLESARKIREGAPSLASARPDLPRAVLDAIDGALATDPARRPPAERLAAELRAARGERQRVRTGPRPRALLRSAERVVPAVPVAVLAGFGASLLPFYPRGWPPALAALAAALAFVRPRAGLAVALATPLLPLGNLSLGAAVLYATLAAGWWALLYGEARAGALPALGPLLAPFGLVALLSGAAQALAARWRRGLAAGVGVLLAPLVAGAGELTRASFAGSDSPLAVAVAALGALAARPALLLAAVAVALVAAFLPLLRRKGPWGIAGCGAVLLAATVPMSAGLAAGGAIAATWVVCGLMALQNER